MVGRPRRKGSRCFRSRARSRSIAARTWSTRHTVTCMKRGFARLAATVLLTGGLALAALGMGAGPAQAYKYGPFQWCPGQAMPNDPPRSDADLVWDMGICHTYYFEYDVRTKAPAHYWEGPNLFPTAIPPPPPPANPPNIAQQCPGAIPFVNCLPGL